VKHVHVETSFAKVEEVVVRRLRRFLQPEVALRQSDLQLMAPESCPKGLHVVRVFTALAIERFEELLERRLNEERPARDRPLQP
jgi:hypothetical protein